MMASGWATEASSSALAFSDDGMAVQRLGVDGDRAAAVLAVPSSSKGAATLAPAGAAAGTSVPVTFDRWPDAPALTALYADLVRQLTSNKPTSELRKRRLRANEPTASCLLGA